MVHQAKTVLTAAEKKAGYTSVKLIVPTAWRGSGEVKRYGYISKTTGELKGGGMSPDVLRRSQLGQGGFAGVKYVQVSLPREVQKQKERREELADIKEKRIRAEERQKEAAEIAARKEPGIRYYKTKEGKITYRVGGAKPPPEYKHEIPREAYELIKRVKTGKPLTMVEAERIAPETKYTPSQLMEMDQQRRITETLTKQRQKEYKERIRETLEKRRKAGVVERWGEMTAEERARILPLPPSVTMAMRKLEGEFEAYVPPEEIKVAKEPFITMVKGVPQLRKIEAKEVIEPTKEYLKVKYQPEIEAYKKAEEITKKKLEPIFASELKRIEERLKIAKEEEKFWWEKAREVEGKRKIIPALMYGVAAPGRRVVEFEKGALLGIKEKPLKVAATLAAFIALPPAIAGVKYGVQVAKGLKVARVLKPLAPFAKVTAAGVKYGLPTAYAISVGARVVGAPTIYARPRAEVAGEIFTTELAPMALGVRVGTRLAFPLEYKTGFLAELQKYPEPVRAEFKRLVKVKEVLAGYEPKPRRFKVEIEKLPREYGKAIEKWVVSHKEQLAISGSVAQRLQTHKAVLKGLKKSGDIDIYTDIGGLPKSLFRELVKVKAPVYLKGAKIYYRGIGKLAEFHPISPVTGKPALVTTLGTVKKPYTPLAEALIKTPEGVRVTKIKYQAMRKLYGGFEQARYRYTKDIPAFKTIVKGVFKGMEQKAEKALIFREVRKRKIAIEKARFFGYEPRERLFEVPELGKRGAIAIGIGKPIIEPKVPKPLYIPREYPIFRGGREIYPSYPVPSYKPFVYPTYPKPYSIPVPYPPPVPVPPLPTIPYRPKKPKKYPPYRPPIKPPKYPPYIPPARPPKAPPYAPPTKPPRYPPYAPPTKPPRYPPYKPPKYPPYRPPPEEPPLLLKLPEFEEPRRKPKRKRKPFRIAPTYKPSLVGKWRYEVEGITIPKPPRAVGLGERPLTKQMIKDIEKIGKGMI